MITAILGKPGHGKNIYSTWLTKMLVEQGLQRGWRVGTNVELTPDFPFFDLVLGMGNVPGAAIPMLKRPKRGSAEEVKAFWQWWETPAGDVNHKLGQWKFVFDEYDKIFPSSMQTELNEFFHQYHSQHRKYNHELFIILQCLENLNTRIRRMIDRYVICENTALSAASAFRYIPKSLSRFVRTVYAGNKFRTEDIEDSGSMSLREASRVWGWYRTEQIIKVA